MKVKTFGIILVWLASVGFACAGTNDITTLVQKGLFEEEANHHLDAAMEYYQEAIGHFDKDRQLAATAIFHLGECYRLQGKTNEANEQYKRIIHEFSDQPQLVELSRGYLPKSGGALFSQNLARIQGSNGYPGSPVVSAPRPQPKVEESTDEQNEMRRIRDMIQNSPDLINESGGDSLLVKAARAGWMSAAKLLMDNGAIINPESPRGSTPLSAAVGAGNKGMVEFLLSKGANANALEGLNGYAPLHIAVVNGYKTVVETLLAHGADVNLPDRDGDRSLQFAAKEGFRSLAEVLLAHKADVNAHGRGGGTALGWAIGHNQVEMVQFLISNKANVNFKSDSGETPLLLAVQKSDINIGIVKALLDNGADTEVSVRGHYPIDIAVNRGRADVVELLLQKNANPNTTTRQDVFELYSLHNRGHYDRTITPLILAIIKDDPQFKIGAILLQHSANPNLADETGKTPLDYAIVQQDTNLIAASILHHADVNALDNQGDPPLAYVSRFVNPDKQGQIKEMLIAAGANEDYQRRGAVFISQKGTGSIGVKVFSKGTNSVDQYTLFELISTVYSSPRGPAIIAFPDLAHVTINRLKADGAKEEIAVDLNAILQSGDCSKNLRLEWGDIILIPQLDHKIDEYWQGLSPSERGALGKCLLRNVKVVVKGQTTQLALFPSIVQRYTCQSGVASDSNLSTSLTAALNGEKFLYGYDLNDVVHDANVLLISSDLSRVKVTRRESEAGKHPQVMEFNLETQPAPVLQLLDGDVIEIPERDQNVKK